MFMMQTGPTVQRVHPLLGVLDLGQTPRRGSQVSPWILSGDVSFCACASSAHAVSGTAVDHHHLGRRQLRSGDEGQDRVTNVVGGAHRVEQRLTFDSGLPRLVLDAHARAEPLAVDEAGDTRC